MKKLQLSPQFYNNCIYRGASCTAVLQVEHSWHAVMDTFQMVTGEHSTFDMEFMDSPVNHIISKN